MQKIMMLAKLWCDHAEGFESGLRAWELCVEIHNDDQYGTVFFFFLGTVCSWYTRQQ